MQSLLRWSIENSTPLDSAPSDRPPVESKNLDPAIIDMILGKSDSELMKEDMSLAVDANRSEDDRINALDHLEMVKIQVILYSSNMILILIIPFTVDRAD